MKNLVAIILAAGEGTRMKSSLSKALHPLSGKPLISWVYENVEKVHPKKIYVVVNKNNNGQILSLLPKKRVIFVEQKRPLGSGDALKRCLPFLKDTQGETLIVCTDTPLLTEETLKNLIARHEQTKNSLTILTTILENPCGYGRLCRSKKGEIIKIIEENDADENEKKIKEVNTGVYCIQTENLCGAVSRLPINQKKGEYYLTDMVEILSKKKEKIESFTTEHPEEVLGINTRKELAQLEKIMRRRILENLMLGGVSIADPDSTYIDAGVLVGEDTLILPGTVIKGKTKIGRDCRIGPQTYIEDCSIGNDVEIRASFLYGNAVGNKAKIGPFAHLRPGSSIGEKVRIGNFTEVKKSKIGAGTKVSHLSYIGDSCLGKNINIGAGVITCNYDGITKHKTSIEDKVFIGSNVNLIAPIKIGRKAVIGAGSTISKDVPAESLAIARSREIIKRNYVLGSSRKFGIHLKRTTIRRKEKK